MKPITRLIRNTIFIWPFFIFNELKLAYKCKKPPKIAPDGFPLPSRWKMVRVFNHGEWELFIDTGKAIHSKLIEYANIAGVDWRAGKKILDWGCGCGRVARHFLKENNNEIVGIDIEGQQINWCKANLPGEYHAVELTPPTKLQTNSFDGVYALSVLTHLSHERQIQWFSEIARILKAGAIAILTFHDEIHCGLGATQISPDRLEGDKVIVTTTQGEGSNLTAAFQSTNQLRTLANSNGFAVIKIIPSNETGFGQAAAILQKN